MNIHKKHGGCIPYFNDLSVIYSQFNTQTEEISVMKLFLHGSKYVLYLLFANESFSFVGSYFYTIFVVAIIFIAKKILN